MRCNLGWCAAIQGGARQFGKVSPGAGWVQVHQRTKEFTRGQLQPAAKRVGDGALDAAGRFRSTAQDTAQQIDQRSAHLQLVLLFA